MSDERRDVYVDEALRVALKGRKEDLTTAVNMMAERYMAMIASCYVPLLPMHDALIVEVLADLGRVPDARDIGMLAALCKDYLRRHPEFPQAPSGIALVILERCSYAELLAIVERIERQ